LEVRARILLQERIPAGHRPSLVRKGIIILHQIEKSASALQIELQELFVFAHEEPTIAKLRAIIHELLQEAGRAELQPAYKLLKALLRSVGR
jgi:hypothetical protein